MLNVTCMALSFLDSVINADSSPDSEKYPKTYHVDLQEHGSYDYTDNGLAKPLDLDKLDEILNCITVTDKEVEDALMDPSLDNVVLPFGLED